MQNTPKSPKVVFLPGFEPGTFRVLGERDNHYTTETCKWPSGASHFWEFTVKVLSPKFQCSHRRSPHLFDFSFLLRTLLFLPLPFQHHPPQKISPLPFPTPIRATLLRHLFAVGVKAMDATKGNTTRAALHSPTEFPSQNSFLTEETHRERRLPQRHPKNEEEEESPATAWQRPGPRSLLQLAKPELNHPPASPSPPRTTRLPSHLQDREGKTLKTLFLPGFEPGTFRV